MFSFRKSLLALVGLSMLIGILATMVAVPSLGQGRTGGGPPTRAVEVVNSAVNPVPVRDVDNPARQPFNATFFTDFQNEQVTADVPFITVPAGKRLVIEHASAQSRFPANDLVSASLLYPALTNGLVEQFLVIHPQGTDHLGNRVFTASEELRAYIAEGGTLRFKVSRDRAGAAVVDGVGVTVSGYFVDVP
jgi:hypothetical protein